MGKKRRIRVMLACGSGVCTSSLVLPQVEEILEDEGYSYEIVKGSIFEIKNHPNLDLVLSSMTCVPPDVLDLGLPIVSFAPLFKGETDVVLKNVRRALNDGERGMIQ